MRKLLLSAAATMLIAGPVSAADLAVKAPPPGPAYIASPWDGLYVGGNVGYGETSFEATATGFGTLASVHGNGVVGGFQAGYNKQYGTFVLGLETDFDLTSIENTTAGVSTKLPWFSKVPGVGWAAGAGLQYAFTPQWSIGAEYLHVELDGPSANVGGISIDTKAKTDLGRATLNYKF